MGSWLPGPLIPNPTINRNPEFSSQTHLCINQTLFIRVRSGRVSQVPNPTAPTVVTFKKRVQIMSGGVGGVGLHENHESRRC